LSARQRRRADGIRRGDPRIRFRTRSQAGAHAAIKPGNCSAADKKSPLI
jgi:hypothetical protein